jgi:hypothetical protein
MANTKISALTSATTPVAGTEVLPIVQSGSTKQVSITNLTAGRSVSGTSFVPTGATIPANGLYLPAANAVGIASNTTNALYITSSQAVGIGTTSPAAKLHVADPMPTITGGIGQLHVFSTDALAANVGGKISLGGVTGYGAPFDPYGWCYVAGLKENATAGNFAAYLAFGTSTSGGTVTERQRISSAGIVTMSAYGAGAATFSAAGVISSVSDETWKIKDGVPSDPDSMLMKLEPGYWYYNDEKKEIFGVDRQLGFYAQNVNAAIGPEAAPVPETTVETTNDGTEISTTKPWGYYDRSVLAVVVMSLQKALVTIESLTERIKALESR